MNWILAAKIFIKHTIPESLPWRPTDTRPSEYAELISSLPRVWGGKLTRIGGDGDGGYLVPDDLAEIQFCFSPGVGPSASFEKDLFDRYGIQSFLADGSVDEVPDGFVPAGFIQKFIGNQTSEQFVTLDDWVNECAPGSADLFLQMDIEGAEYETLVSVSDATLRRFRIAVVEFHDLAKLHHRTTFRRFAKTMRRMASVFRIVHVHPNNNGPVGRLGDFDLPDYIEVTFLRNDRAFEAVHEPIWPHELDRPNVAGEERRLTAPWVPVTYS